MSTQQDLQYFYYRLMTIDGRACLVRRTSLRHFDSEGRIVTVSVRVPSFLPRRARQKRIMVDQHIVCITLTTVFESSYLIA